MPRPSVIDLRNDPRKAKSRPENEDRILHKWQAHEYVQYERGVRWYIIMVSVMLLAIGVSIYIRNVMMAVTFVLLSILLYVYSRREPREVAFLLTNRSLVAGTLEYDYQGFKSFWVFEPHGSPAYLSIQRNKVYLPYLSIPLGEEDPNVIREYLKQFVPEVKQEEEFTDIIARLFKL